MPGSRQEERSDTPDLADIDFSLIQLALRDRGPMIEQILTGLHYGSSEVRHLILQQSDFIMECRFCRNMFRALPNFIAHKRIYCRQTYREDVDLIPQGEVIEETVIVQPEVPVDNLVEEQFTSEQANFNNSVNNSTCISDRVTPSDNQVESRNDSHAANSSEGNKRGNLDTSKNNATGPKNLTLPAKKLKGKAKNKSRANSKSRDHKNKDHIEENSGTGGTNETQHPEGNNTDSVEAPPHDTTKPAAEASASLLHVISQLKSDSFEGKSVEYKLYTRLARKAENENVRRQTQVLELRPIPGVTNVVSQVLVCGAAGKGQDLKATVADVGEAQATDRMEVDAAIGDPASSVVSGVHAASGQPEQTQAELPESVVKKVKEVAAVQGIVAPNKNDDSCSATPESISVHRKLKSSKDVIVNEQGLDKGSNDDQDNTVDVKNMSSNDATTNNENGSRRRNSQRKTSKMLLDTTTAVCKVQKRAKLQDSLGNVGDKKPVSGPRAKSNENLVVKNQDDELLKKTTEDVTDKMDENITSPEQSNVTDVDVDDKINISDVKNNYSVTGTPKENLLTSQVANKKDDPRKATDDPQEESVLVARGADKNETTKKKDIAIKKDECKNRLKRKDIINKGDYLTLRSNREIGDINRVSSTVLLNRRNNRAKTKTDMMLPVKSPNVSREMINNPNIDAKKLVCLICNFRFSSFRTLCYHMQTKHTLNRRYFLCPACSGEFVHIWGLTRHLRLVHCYSKVQVEKMRKNLHQTSFVKVVREDDARSSEESQSGQSENECGRSQYRGRNKSTGVRKIKHRREASVRIGESTNKTSRSDIKTHEVEAGPMEQSREMNAGDEGRKSKHNSKNQVTPVGKTKNVRDGLEKTMEVDAGNSTNGAQTNGVTIVQEKLEVLNEMTDIKNDKKNAIRQNQMAMSLQDSTNKSSPLSKSTSTDESIMPSEEKVNTPGTTELVSTSVGMFEGVHTRRSGQERNVSDGVRSDKNQSAAKRDSVAVSKKTAKDTRDKISRKQFKPSSNESAERKLVSLSSKDMHVRTRSADRQQEPKSFAKINRAQAEAETTIKSPVFDKTTNKNMLLEKAEKLNKKRSLSLKRNKIDTVKEAQPSESDTTTEAITLPPSPSSHVYDYKAVAEKKAKIKFTRRRKDSAFTPRSISLVTSSGIHRDEFEQSVEENNKRKPVQPLKIRDTKKRKTSEGSNSTTNQTHGECNMEQQKSRHVNLSASDSVRITGETSSDTGVGNSPGKLLNPPTGDQEILNSDETCIEINVVDSDSKEIDLNGAATDVAIKTDLSIKDAFTELKHSDVEDKVMESEENEPMRVIKRRDKRQKQKWYVKTYSRYSAIDGLVDKSMTTCDIFQCSMCNLAFENITLLAKHVRQQHEKCESMRIGNDSVFSDSSDEEKSQPSKKDVSKTQNDGTNSPAIERTKLIEEIWIGKAAGKPAERLKSSRVYVVDSRFPRSKPTCQDSKKIDALIDDSNVQCLKCGEYFASIPNLRRHVIRHLGWKRYQCSICRYKCYNLSECKTHMNRTHRSTYTFSDIIDLNKEASKVRFQKKQHTLSARQMQMTLMSAMTEHRRSRKKSNENMNVKEESFNKFVTKEQRMIPSKVKNISRFNISTRNCPRQFDVTPYIPPPGDHVADTGDKMKCTEAEVSEDKSSSRSTAQLFDENTEHDDHMVEVDEVSSTQSIPADLDDADSTETGKTAEGETGEHVMRTDTFECESGDVEKSTDDTTRKETVQLMDTETVQLIDPETVQPNDTETVQLKDTETVQPNDTETVQLKDTETVQPNDTETVQLKDTETVQPNDTETVQLKDTETVQPKETESVQLIDPETVQPNDTETVQLKDTETVQPKETEIVRLIDPETVQPNDTETLQPKDAEIVQPKYTETVQLKDNSADKTVEHVVNTRMVEHEASSEDKAEVIDVINISSTYDSDDDRDVSLNTDAVVETNALNSDTHGESSSNTRLRELHRYAANPSVEIISKNDVTDIVESTIAESMISGTMGGAKTIENAHTGIDNNVVFTGTVNVVKCRRYVDKDIEFIEQMGVGIDDDTDMDMGANFVDTSAVTRENLDSNGCGVEHKAYAW